MRTTHRITISLGAAALAALVLVGCSGTATKNDAAPKPSSPATVSSAPTGGVADDSGTCADGVSTPVKSDATFSLDECDFVDVMGSGNTITADALQKLTVEGDENTITVDSVAEVTTAGKGNTIYYSGDEPVHNEIGSGTTLMPLSEKQDKTNKK
ncbi:DUF3060 domain-containing protein [Curtobacterium oceanosedimentum]|uniref:DUF3060 domain-containing protein n=1 Tax=Curtobacterium oceanosedimentum TaxID=465820 RepID=UPI001CE15443|nr:DUF3060 domain-containing protein [Curtobacterium oceanosedimentum]MCA5922355.1 DUF3060 domain-containing protein [Curtobacterium oceanosedimentum]